MSAPTSTGLQWPCHLSFVINRLRLIIIVFNSQDGTGKYPDKDFNGKEYLLQDTDSNYWSIRLSVKKVEEEEFLKDIRSQEPGYTYILSYLIPSGGRHAVYVKSCDHNLINCLNSWGNLEPEPKIPLQTKGNIFYRVFCTTFIVLSSSGPSAEHQGGTLGVFEYLQQHNNSPAYRQRHTVADTQPRYLYRNYHGNWLVGEELGGSAGGLQSPTVTPWWSSVVFGGLLNGTKSPTVPPDNWQYYAGSKGGWQSDAELTRSSYLPSVCETVQISLGGAAARAHPSAAGDFRATGDWSAGRPVFSNGLTYLCVRPG